MTSLPHLLRARLQPDERLWSKHHDAQKAQIIKRYKESGAINNFHCDFHKGAVSENARLQPLLEQMILCVEALEFYADPQSKTFCSGDYEAKADEALAALAALVEK